MYCIDCILSISYCPVDIFLHIFCPILQFILFCILYCVCILPLLYFCPFASFFSFTISSWLCYCVHVNFFILYYLWFCLTNIALSSFICSHFFLSAWLCYVYISKCYFLFGFYETRSLLYFFFFFVHEKHFACCHLIIYRFCCIIMNLIYKMLWSLIENRI